MASRRGVDRLAITDHNTIRGALIAKSLDPLRVIVGEEIKTTAGELLAFFVQEEVPQGLSPMETIRLLKEQGAFISVSHPFDIYRSGWRLTDLMEIVPYIDAIEVFNARCYLAGYNQRALKFSLQNGIPGTAGSDAHLLTEVGRAIVRLPEFSSAEDLRYVIRQGQFEATLSPFLVHLGSGLISIGKKITDLFLRFGDRRAANP